MTIDRLSRIAALRPVVPRSNASALFHNRDNLMHRLAAECRRNELGQHLAVRRWVPALQPRFIQPQTLELLSNGCSVDASDTSQWLFLDTETTGLAGGTGTYAFLVGIAWWENGGLAIEQLFMRDHAEEASLLLALKERLAQRRVLVTFNGKAFDWPLLLTRYRMIRAAEHPIAPRAHFDLLHPARQLWRLRLHSVALSELERQVLALDRGTDIPSHTIPTRYFEFLRGGPSEPVAEVFRHNELDLRGLVMLALRMTTLLENPDSSTRDGSELYGISRMLQRRGDPRTAAKVFEQALTSGLPARETRKAQRELAWIARRNGDFARANHLWEQLLGDTVEGFEAYEQLAIHYEHRARQPVRAVALTREALVHLMEGFRSGRVTPPLYREWHARLQHRLSRLTHKVGLKNLRDSSCS